MKKRFLSTYIFAIFSCLLLAGCFSSKSDDVVEVETESYSDSVAVAYVVLDEEPESPKGKKIVNPENTSSIDFEDYSKFNYGEEDLDTQRETVLELKKSLPKK